MWRNWFAEFLSTELVLRILHLSISRQFSHGQINQLRYEDSASKTIKDVEWVTLGYHRGSEEGRFIKKIPVLFRPIFLRSLYGWLLALRLSKEYDVLLMRHMTFDPFALIFSFFIHNRVSVHHSKEIEELKLVRSGWRGRFASLVEAYTGRVAVRNTKMILGVTEEIARYEQKVRAPWKPFAVYPNGIDVDSVKKLHDARFADQIHMAFICGSFSHWHGLDKIIAAANVYKAKKDCLPMHIHLIGQLSQKQLFTLSSIGSAHLEFHTHGLMRPEEYRPILAKCDFGVGSLALERKGLKEASTLKVREMLALGLPVYAGHKDVALMKNCPWARVVSEVTLSDLQDFGVSMKKISRDQVRGESSHLIAKADIMKDTVVSLRNVFGVA